VKKKAQKLTKFSPPPPPPSVSRILQRKTCRSDAERIAELMSRNEMSVYCSVHYPTINSFILNFIFVWYVRLSIQFVLLFTQHLLFASHVLRSISFSGRML